MAAHARNGPIFGSYFKRSDVLVHMCMSGLQLLGSAAAQTEGSSAEARSAPAQTEASSAAANTEAGLEAGSAAGGSVEGEVSNPPNKRRKGRRQLGSASKHNLRISKSSQQEAEVTHPAPPCSIPLLSRHINIYRLSDHHMLTRC